MLKIYAIKNITVIKSSVFCCYFCYLYNVSNITDEKSVKKAIKLYFVTTLLIENS